MTIANVFIRTFIPALPFCHLTLKAKKPVSRAYPQSLNTISDHLIKKRLDLNLLQQDVAAKLGVDGATIYNWESNRSSPRLSFVRKIIEFL